MNRSFLLSFLAASILFVSNAVVPTSVVQAQTSQPDTVRRDSREQAPEALLGIWKADIEASSYPESSTPPLEHFRIFQYTEGGKVMVIFLTLSATGGQSSGHWAVQVDGTPGQEYASWNASTAYADIALTKVDETTFNVTAAYQGVETATSVYKLTDDGKTLSVDRTASNGNRQFVVYKRWGAAD